MSADLHRLMVKVSPQAAPGVGDAMLSLGRGIEEQPRSTEVRLITYLAAAEDVSRARRRIRERIAALREAGLEVGAATITVRSVPSRTWEQALAAGMEVVRVPPRIAVKPAWKRYVAQPGEVVVELDSGMAFGTGEHTTTRGCLGALGRCIFGGEVVFDVGAGSGILSVAAAKLGAVRVAAIEIDEQAARIAAHHVELNHVATAVAVICANGLRSVRGRADVVVANLTSRDIAALAPHVSDHLAAEGIFIASGISVSHGDAVRAAAGAAGLSLRERRREGEWLTMIWGPAGDASAAG